MWFIRNYLEILRDEERKEVEELNDGSIYDSHMIVLKNKKFDVYDPAKYTLEDVIGIQVAEEVWYPLGFPLQLNRLDDHYLTDEVGIIVREPNGLWKRREVQPDNRPDNILQVAVSGEFARLLKSPEVPNFTPGVTVPSRWKLIAEGSYQGADYWDVAIL